MRLPRRPVSVAVAGGLELPVRRTSDSHAKALTGWWYDTGDRVLHVKLPPAAGEQQVLIRAAAGMSN